MTGPVLPRWSRLAVAALAGVLIAAGGAPLEAWMLPWAGVMLLHLALEDAWRGARAMRRGAVVGLVAGFTANAMSMGWAVSLFEEHAFMIRPLATLLAALLWLAQTLPFVLTGLFGAAAFTVLSHRTRWLATPLAIVLGGTLGPMFFPWRVGTAETAFLPIASWASIGGVGLVDVAIALPAVALITAVRPGPLDLERGITPGSPGVRAAVALAMLGLAVLGGAGLHAWAGSVREGGRRLRVGLAHTTLSIAERHDPLRWEPNHLALLRATAALEAEGADVVLWPETSYAFHWPRARRADAVGIESVIARGVRGPLVFGSITYERRARYNSVVAVGRDGVRIGIVDKRVLMPFSERIPYYELLTPWHRELPPSLTPAPAPGALEVEGVRIGVLNCYEDLSDQHTRWLAELHHPHLLSNHTNDAWFGEHGAELHLFLSRLRAIETGRDLVRVVNGGLSAHVASTGEIVARRGPHEPRTLLCEVRLADHHTLFVRFGDWVGASAIGALLALIVTARRR